MTEEIIKDKFYTVKEAAELLKFIKPQTVSKYLRDGDMLGEKKGPKKQWHIKGSEIIKKIEDWNMVDK